MGRSEDTNPGPPVILHAHADTYGDSCNDPHDEHDSKHDASNRGAPEKENRTVCLNGLQGAELQIQPTALS